MLLSTRTKTEVTFLYIILTRTTVDATERLTPPKKRNPKV